MDKTQLEKLILSFPPDNISLAFGYGSKVVKQTTGNHGNLVDLIIAVDDPLKWHKANMKLNNHHYSFVRHLPNPIETVVKIQEHYGAQIYFNPYVSIDDIMVKYGIIKTQHLIDDLLRWSNLYVSGRLHKPVEFVLNTSDKNEKLRSSLQFNRESAIRAALLLLPETFELSQLFETITKLSYKGDPRMLFGEDKNKVQNIVANQMDRFGQIYMPIIKTNYHFKENVIFNESKRTISQDLSSTCVLKNLRLLPSNVRRLICEVHERSANTTDSDLVLTSASKSINTDKIVERALARIVRRSSTSQSVKGLITAGFIKSIMYGQRKLSKSLVSRLAPLRAITNKS